MARTGDARLILAPPDVEGFLAAAALRRAGNGDVQFLSSYELSRRLAALADEPAKIRPTIVDLVPTDSLDTLLIPALEALAAKGARAAWIYGRAQPVPGLRALSELIDLRYEEGADAWRLVVDENDDPGFWELAGSIEEESSEMGIAWKLLLRSLASSWDWTRIYGKVRELSALAEVDDADLRWVRLQLAEAERGERLVALAPTRTVGGASFAVVVDRSVAARLRPDVFASSRPDVDAVLFVAGPGRIIVVATHPDADLRVVEELAREDGVTVGSPRGPRLDIAWQPGTVPDGIRALIGERAAKELVTDFTVAKARVVHAAHDRIAKGLDGSKLAEIDRAVVRDGLRALEE